MKSILVFLFANAVLFFNCIAQTPKIDSLKTKVATAKNQTEKLALLQALCRHNSSMPADTLKLYAGQALQLAMLQKDIVKIWEAEYIYAFSLQQESLTDSSLLLCNRLLEDIKDLDKNFSIYHEALGLKTSCLKKQNKIKEATGTAYQMLASAEKYNDVDGQINAYVLLTIVRGQLNNFDDPNATDTYLRQCITWYKKAISLFKDSSYYKKYDRVLANLGMTYFQLPQSNYDSAFYFINLALHYAKEQGQLRIMASCLAAKGNIFYAQKKWDAAEYYYQQEAAVDRQIGDPERIALSFSSLRNIYREKKEFKKALSYDIMERDYCLVRHMPIDVSLYADLAEDYKSLGNYKAYGETLDTLVNLRDSLYQANSAMTLGELQTKYEVRKKENTIIRQKYDIARKRYFIYGISGLLLLLFVFGMMVFKYRKQRQQQQIKELTMESERKTAQAINNAKEEERKRIIADLHDDVGGGLSTIRMVSDLIAAQQEQTQQLSQYAHKISGITKEVTQRMNTIVWALNAENDTLQSLSEYIRQYGFSFFEDSTITFKSNLPENADTVQLSGLQRKNIFLCVKEALNNVYKHSDAKNTWIDIGFGNNLLTVAIHDDGNGLSNTNPLGNGLRNIQNRMKEINGEVEFSSDVYTSVVLKVNYR